jgi:hypothetical protein
MKTRKDWTELKKKRDIPDGALKGVEFGPALEKCAKVVNSDRPSGDKLKAVNEFRKVYTRYSKEVDNVVKTKAKAFLAELGAELDQVEKEAFEAAAAKKDGKGVVVNLDPKDKTINEASKSIAKDRKLGADKALRRVGESDDETDAKGHQPDVTKKDTDLSKASSEPIVILAHGTPIGKHGSGKVRASQFAGKSASDITEFVAKTLDKTYHGIVYLDGCFTAAGNTPMNFAKLVYDGLVKKGYHYLQVKGNLGAAITVDGKEFVIPAELDKEYDKLKDERDKLDAKIKETGKQYGDAQLEITKKMSAMLKGRSPNAISDEEKKQLEKLESGYKSLVKLEKENRELETMKARRKVVNDTIEKDLKIEALTGTFGPERLPPRA